MHRFFRNKSHSAWWLLDWYYNDRRSLYGSWNQLQLSIMIPSGRNILPKERLSCRRLRAEARALAEWSTETLLAAVSERESFRTLAAVA